MGEEEAGLQTLSPKLSAPPVPITGSWKEAKSWPQPLPTVLGDQFTETLQRREGQKDQNSEVYMQKRE